MVPSFLVLPHLSPPPFSTELLKQDSIPPKYYSGEKKAPLLTIVIGGNHEASNYLAELAYGGWLCENIYYMGYAGVVSVNGIRIAGISGIYKGHDYLKGHFEVPPYTDSTKRSAYHLRNLEIFRLKQILDIPTTTDEPPRLSYDLEWLCVLQLTDHLLRIDSKNHYMPGPGCGQRWQFTPTKEEKEKLAETCGSDFQVPLNFQHTAPVYTPGSERSPGRVKPYVNPQTESFCKRFGLRDPLAEALDPRQQSPPLDISGFLGTEDVTNTTMSSLNESENLDQEQSPETDLDDGPIPLHEMSVEERQKVHTVEFGSIVCTSEEKKELFPELIERTEDVALKSTPSPSGRVMKRRNQSLYTESEETDS
ncbi:hypothetical protein HPB50_006749 [Hyalomma asiaticum]|uniref:Uncharacterized protein n=1 Tax=Hyalomma asiaticum TaxID=266040 RepID=A0ACB7TI34_HYAAI|nr:hypothetical protein HPB50_006749 [Hyalomma asiaticum]